RMFWRKRSKVVDRLIDTGCQTGSRHIVAQNSTIDDLCEESRLRDEFAHELRNVLLPFGRKRLLISGSTSKRDDYHLSLLAARLGSSSGGKAQQRAAQCESGTPTQELAATPREPSRKYFVTSCTASCAQVSTIDTH